jgi:N-acetylglutamate synthase-like GNAT family acetyltransferase
MNALVRRAKAEDAEKIISFLHKARLKSEGVAENIEDFFVMEDEYGRVKATIGMESFSAVGLVRSLALTIEATEEDVFQLFQEIFITAKEKGIIDMYLATNKLGAMTFVKLLGFEEIDHGQLPMVLGQSKHVQHILLMENTVFLKKSL